MPLHDFLIEGFSVVGDPGTCAKGEHTLDSLLWGEEIFADLVDVFGLFFEGFASDCSVEQAFACQ